MFRIKNIPAVTLFVFVLAASLFIGNRSGLTAQAFPPENIVFPITAEQDTQSSLQAPSTTSPSSKPTFDRACPAGEWEVDDLQQTMAESFEQAQSNLHLQSVEGRVRYSLSSAGLMTLTYDQLAAVLTGEVSERAVTVRQSLDGSAAARYQVDEANQELVLSDFGEEGITFALEINDQTLAEGSLPIWRAFVSGMHGSGNLQPTPLVRYARLAVTCAGDTMTVRAVDPLPGPSITLRRRR